MTLIFLLLVIYQVKHWLADYLLQGRYMLGKFKGGYDWILPLAAHTAVHGAFTFFIAYFLMSWNGWKFSLALALFDFAAHFVMDRVKASPNMMGRWKALSAREWLDAQANLDPWDCTIHDAPRIKAIAKQQLRGNTLFWWCLGFDQMYHHLTHYFIIWMLVR